MEQDFNLNNIRLIVGLGNIGDDYKITRHNAGFMFVDQLIAAWHPQLNWTSHKELQADLAIHKHAELMFILAKPTTMMNLSGHAVTKIMNYYKLEPSQVVIAHDDLDLNLGESKLQFGRGPKGHNGITSVEQFLSTKDFWRVRLGVDAREVRGNKGIPGETYALERFKAQELETITSVIDGVISEYFSLIA